MDWDNTHYNETTTPINLADTTFSLRQSLDADECRKIALGLLATLRVQEAETSAYQSA